MFILHCYNEVKLFWFCNKASFCMLYPGFQHTHERQHRHGREGHPRYLFGSHWKMASISCQWWKPKREPGSAECAGHSSVFVSTFLFSVCSLSWIISLCVCPSVRPSFFLSVFPGQGQDGPSILVCPVESLVPWEARWTAGARLSKCRWEV